MKRNWVGAASSNGGEAFPVDAGEELSVSESHPVVTQRGEAALREEFNRLYERLKSNQLR